MLYVIMATRNEADRWLQKSLEQLLHLNLPVLVCDDQSTDSTAEIADTFENTVVIERPDNVAPFMEHEGYYRQWCWESLREVHGPTEDDWVISIDADELLVGKVLPGKSPIAGWTPQLHEVWGFDDDGTPLVRVDGFWAKSHQPRLAPWNDDVEFPDRRLASGSLPTYARREVGYTQWITILHLGYARAEDRAAKYERYTQHPFGHNPQHIESILTRPTLERWNHEVPCLQPA